MAKGRQLALQVLHTLRKTVRFSDGASAVVTIGTLPIGALVVGGGIHVSTVYNAGTNNNIDIGTAADPDGFASAIAMTSAGFKVFDELATSDDLLMAAETDVIATLGLTGTAATAGVAQIIVQYAVNNDG
jgi:hypothetical protein